MSETEIKKHVIEFAAWKDRNFMRLDQNAYVPLYHPDALKAKRLTYEDLYDLFKLTIK